MDIVSDEVKRVRFKKLQAKYIAKVIEKNNYQLTNTEWLQLLTDSDYQSNYLQLKRIKRIMNSEVVRQDTDNKLINFFISSGYGTKELKQLLDDAIKFMRAKEQGSQLFEVYKHLESKHFPESKTKVTQQEHLNTEQELTSISRTITKEVNE